MYVGREFEGEVIEVNQTNPLGTTRFIVLLSLFAVFLVLCENARSQTTTKNPDGSTTVTTPDGKGGTTETTTSKGADGKDVTREVQKDKDGRPTHATEKDGDDVTEVDWYYDKDGRPIRIVVTKNKKYVAKVRRTYKDGKDLTGKSEGSVWHDQETEWVPIGKIAEDLIDGILKRFGLVLYPKIVTFVALPPKEERKDPPGSGPGKQMSSEPSAPTLAPASFGMTTITTNGLQTVRFDSAHGAVIVNLPSDLRAGDTISGTVFIEPTGTSENEKAANESILNGVVLDLSGKRITAGGGPAFTWTPPMPAAGAPVRYQLKIVEVRGDPAPLSQAAAVITPEPMTTPAGQASTKFIIPSIGQTGRNIIITGPFTGDSSNTTVVADQSGQSAGLMVLAESKRMSVVQSPRDLTGPLRLSVNNGTMMTTAMFRNIGVSLSAPKTSLLKGEKTTLTVTVIGLQGIKEPVSLSLQSTGVVAVSGGMTQTLEIKPSQVGANGTYSTTREITGIQAGGWTATASVRGANP